jgi:hypothetical protein
MSTRAPAVELRHLKSSVIVDAFKSIGFECSEDDPTAHLIWWDGLPTGEDFGPFRSGQKVNKIPRMDRLCYKSTLFQLLNQMQTLFPSYYTFYPRTLILPHQFNEFQKEHTRLSGKVDRLTWILKPESGCCGAGIRLVQEPFDLIHESSPAVIQQYLNPYLLDGFKFDFRFYILIADLLPLTVYIYQEGIARFCTKKYHAPNRHNLNERFSHLTNTAVNVENESSQNENFTRKASEVIAEMPVPDLWERIKTCTVMTILALYPQIMMSVCHAGERRHSGIDPLHRYFQILGIDIMINERGDPMVLELNDRPSMKVTVPFEYTLKKSLIVDAMKLVSINGSEIRTDSEVKWERLFPVDDTHPLYRIMRAIQQRSLNVFGPKTNQSAAATQAKAIVYPKPVPDRNRVMFRSYRFTFQ